MPFDIVSMAGRLNALDLSIRLSNFDRQKSSLQYNKAIFINTVFRPQLARNKEGGLKKANSQHGRTSHKFSDRLKDILLYKMVRFVRLDDEERPFVVHCSFKHLKRQRARENETWTQL